MQRYGLPIVLALVIGLAFIGLRSFGGDDDPELPIDLEPISVTHSTEAGLVFELVNNSENAFQGDVRVQVAQANTSVTKTVRIEIAAFGVAGGEVDGDWAAGAGSPVIQLLLDPQDALPDTENGNDSVTLTCPTPDAACELQN
jgi:hypothetical protein